MPVRLSREDQIGEAGQAAAISFFNDLGWGPLPTGKHDLGTDLFVQIRANDLVDLGMMLGVQIKTGDSWFRRRAEVDGRSGWWFTENDDKHRSYWSDHHIPHILLMQDESRTRRYWVRLDRNTIESTGQGIKVFVPADQTLSGQVAEEWIALVADARKQHSFEGASWNFDITQVPEQDWPRYALLAPRIVAPHANRGYADDINWAEALALAVHADHRRWDGFAQERDAVPSAAEAAASDDPGWRFAAAVDQWMAGATDQLEALVDIDLSQPLRVAHAICMSLVLEERGDRHAAIDLLAGLQGDEEPSIDQAWIALHRGWLHYEQGDFEDAGTQVNLSVAMHNSFQSGLVNSAIRSAGVLALFDMAPFMARDIAEVVQASDSTLSWWRNHQLESALNGYLRNSFKTWVDDGSVTFGQSDSTHNDLVSAQFSARLLGNRRSARYAAYLRAIANLTLPRGPHASPAAQFETLREAGHDSELVNALKRFRRDGPLAPLAEYMSGVQVASATTTSIRATLKSVEEAGAYMEPARAHEWLDYLLNAFNDPTAHVARYRLEFDPRRDLLEAIAGLDVHYRPQDEARLIQIALALESAADQLLVRRLQRCFRGMRAEAVAGCASDFTARAAELEPGSWAARLLVDTASPYDVSARAEVSRRILAGDMTSIPSGFKIDELTIDEASALIERLRSDVASFVDQFNGIGVGGPDPYLTLAMIAQAGPEQLRDESWDALLEALAHTDVIHERKSATIDYLAETIDTIPTSRISTLIEVATDLREEPPRLSGISFLNTEPHAPACRRLLLAASDEDEVWQRTIGEMLLGSPDDRTFAIRILTARPGHELLLLALSKDDDRVTSRQALHGLARRATEETDIARMASTVLLNALASGGEEAALHVGGGVLAATNRCPESAPFIEALRLHQSATLRRLASELDEPPESP